MADTIPKWAFDRAEQLASDVCRADNCYILERTHWFKALALYVAAHEEAPVDPLTESARRIAYGIRKRICTTDLVGQGDVPSLILAGKWDDHQLVRAARDGLVRGMELAREQANV